MSYVIPDPRFEMPELLTPGRKPVGNVVIDKGNKYGKHALKAFVPTNSMPLGVIEGKLSVVGTSAYVTSKGIATFVGNVAGDKFTWNRRLDNVDELTFLIRMKKIN